MWDHRPSQRKGCEHGELRSRYCRLWCTISVNSSLGGSTLEGGRLSAVKPCKYRHIWTSAPPLSSIIPHFLTLHCYLRYSIKWNGNIHDNGGETHMYRYLQQIITQHVKKIKFFRVGSSQTGIDRNIFTLYFEKTMNRCTIVITSESSDAKMRSHSLLLNNPLVSCADFQQICGETIA